VGYCDTSVRTGTPRTLLPVPNVPTVTPYQLSTPGQLEEISDKLVNTNDKLSDLIGAQEVVHAERRAAVLEANRWRNSYSTKEKELLAANQRIKEFMTSATLVVPAAAVTERSTNSPTETPFLPRGEVEWMSC